MKLLAQGRRRGRLIAALEGEPAGLTTREIARRAGASTDEARRDLRALQEQIMRLSGRLERRGSRTVLVWRLLPKG